MKIGRGSVLGINHLAVDLPKKHHSKPLYLFIVVLGEEVGEESKQTGIQTGETDGQFKGKRSGPEAVVGQQRRSRDCRHHGVSNTSRDWLHWFHRLHCCST